MKVPLEIVFRGVEKTEAVEDLIREKAAKLDQITDNLISCRVVVEKAQQHQQSGNPFQILIDLRVPPGRQLVVKQTSTEGDLHDPLPKTLRAAFDSARRQLRELVERERGKVKVQPAQETTAVVIRLFKEEGYGFIRAMDGLEYYFHENSVLNENFDRLELGTGVRFTASEGEKGPQASSVQIIEKL